MAHKSSLSSLLPYEVVTDTEKANDTLASYLQIYVDSV